MRSANAPGVDGLGKALPVASDELDDLFVDFLPHDGVLLAVSGGRDSLALLVLASQWCAARKHSGQKRPRLRAITIDHRLRADAHAEGEFVSTLCSKLDIPHSILRVAEGPPMSGLQAWAREARYASLNIAALETGCTAIATGHQAEDQAEVVLMRLGRGSGLNGLAGMKPDRKLHSHNLLRPLLRVSRARLTATLVAEQVAWIDDPSNTDVRFERSAFAAHAPSLEALGLTPEPLGLSARRLQDARDALEWATDQAIAAMPDCLEALNAGYAVLPCAAYDPLPYDIRRRLIAKCIGAVSGDEEAPRLERIEALVARLDPTALMRPSSQTLGGCVISRDGSSIMISREPGRDGFPILALEPGETGVWDRRFLIAVPTRISDSIQIRAYSDAANPPSELAKVNAIACPKQARAALPTFWQGDSLVSVPHLDFAKPPYTVRVNAAEQPDLKADWVFTPSETTFSAVALPYSRIGCVPMDASSVTE